MIKTLGAIVPIPDDVEQHELDLQLEHAVKQASRGFTKFDIISGPTLEKEVVTWFSEADEDGEVDSIGDDFAKAINMDMTGYVSAMSRHYTWEIDCE